MASKRTLSMVSRALKGPVPAPFSKPTKENYRINDQLIKENNKLQNTGTILTQKNHNENVVTDSDNTLDKERGQIPMFSPVIDGDISLKETHGLTNISREKNLESPSELLSCKEIPTGKCTELSTENSQVELKKPPTENQASENPDNRGLNLKISFPLTTSLAHNLNLRIESKQKAEVYNKGFGIKTKGCVQTGKPDNNFTGSSKTSEENEDNNNIYNVKSLKSLCLKQVSETMKLNDNVLNEKVSSTPKSHFQIDEENSDKNEDFSGTDSGDEWGPKNDKRRRISSSSSSSSSSRTSSESSSGSTSSSSSSSTSNSSDSIKKGKKRRRNEASWKKNKTKALKNSGKEYTSRTGKIVPAKTMKPPCSAKCRLSCASKFTPSERKNIFDSYWQLSSFQRQRDYLSSCTTVLNVPYRRIKAIVTKERKPNCCFSFLREGKVTRVCKTFLINTLGIGERTLRSVTEAKTSGTGVVPLDGRGKHSKHRKHDPEITLKRFSQKGSSKL